MGTQVVGRPVDVAQASLAAAHVILFIRPRQSDTARKSDGIIVVHPAPVTVRGLIKALLTKQEGSLFLIAQEDRVGIS
jgi:hypothetical protein